MKIKISGLVSKKEMKKETNTEAIYCTKAERELLWFIVNSQINWREGGCLNKDEEVDEKKMKLAKSVLEKI